MNPSDPISFNKKPSKMPLLVLSLLFVLALVFGLWAFSQMQSYKNKATQKTSAAKAADKKAAETQAKYDELAKSPYKTYHGSPTYGSVSFSYPKNWSVYDASDNEEPLNLYFYPDIVPKPDSNTNYALRVEVLATDYASTVQQFSEQVADGSLKASAYIPPKMKTVANIQAGTKLDGTISQSDSGSQQGSIVIIKLRDKTLQISTLSKDSLSDFTGVVLDSLTFVP